MTEHLQNDSRPILVKAKCFHDAVVFRIGVRPSEAPPPPAPSKASKACGANTCCASSTLENTALARSWRHRLLHMRGVNRYEALFPYRLLLFPHPFVPCFLPLGAPAQLPMDISHFLSFYPQTEARQQRPRRGWCCYNLHTIGLTTQSRSLIRIGRPHSAFYGI